MNFSSVLKSSRSASLSFSRWAKTSISIKPTLTKKRLDVVRNLGLRPHVKKIVPGPIDAGGTGSRTGLRAKATRAGTNGNVRLLLRDGSSVQENRIVTTAMDRETGERVRADLNEALREAELQER